MTPEEVRRRRDALGFTQAQLARALGVDVGTISRWERGARAVSAPAAKLLRMLAPEPPQKGGGKRRR